MAVDRERVVQGGIGAACAALAWAALAPLHSGQRGAAGVVLLCAWGLTGWALHRYGRCG